MSYTPRWIEHLRDYMVGNIHLILTWRVGFILMHLLKTVAERNAFRDLKKIGVLPLLTLV